MCGICGIVAFDRQEQIERARIEAMNDQIGHRGPDGHGYYVKENVALGHRRLSIIDLSGGHQPLANEDGTVWIVFNGEIYNHKDLHAELIGKGHVFKTRSDTEAIVHAYEEWGVDCPERLRGMFAFAIWDERRRRLLIARDRLGKKPLYYYQTDRYLIFGSEIKSLLTHPEVKAELNLTALNRYLSLRYVPGPDTMFKNIYKLQPGHALICDDQGVRIKKYWELAYRERAPRPLSAEIEEFRHLLKECVGMRLMSEVPLGVFLSGGLDSSAVVAMMSALGVGNIKTFSVGYEGESDANELDYARIVAQHFATEHYEFLVKPSEFAGFLEDFVWYMDEPVADTACLPLYFISKLARRHATVVLSGEGADELLAGYSIYQRMLTLESIHRYYWPVAAIARPLWTTLTPATMKARKYLLMAGLPFEARYRGVSNAFSDELKAELWQLNGANGEGDIARLFSSYYEQARGAARLNQMLYADTKVWLPDDLLVKADKMTMANSQELRTPFLDHVLMEYAASLPIALKINNGSGKYVLKAAMRGILPAEIIERPKRGFPTPIKQWFARDLSAHTRTLLLASEARVARYFNIDKIAKLLAQHESGKFDRKEELFTLLVFEYWHRRFLG